MCARTHARVTGSWRSWGPENYRRRHPVRGPMTGRMTVTEQREDLQNRTCATCACVYAMEAPRIQTDLRGKTAAQTPTLYICRLNPPLLLATPEGPRLQQQQTFPYMSCWHWTEPGTLPGDKFPSGKTTTHVRV